MRLDLLKPVYQEEEGGEGGSGGAGGETLEELREKFNDLNTQFNAVKAKNDELLTEAKRAKNAKREAEEAARQEELAKHQASNNYKELHKSSELEREKLVKRIADLEGANAKEKRDAAANKLASTLAEGFNVELLADSVKKRLKFTDGEVKVLDANGALTVSSLDDLAKEFKNDPKYASLLKGNKSSGGGANGGSKGSGATDKTLTREEFNALDHTARSKFSRDGGKVVDTT